MNGADWNDRFMWQRLLWPQTCNVRAAVCVAGSVRGRWWRAWRAACVVLVPVQWGSLRKGDTANLRFTSRGLSALCRHYAFLTPRVRRSRRRSLRGSRGAPHGAPAVLRPPAFSSCPSGRRRPRPASRVLASSRAASKPSVSSSKARLPPDHASPPRTSPSCL